MDPARLERRGDYEWHVPATGTMRVLALIFADEALVRTMDDKVFDQVTNVARLPGIVQASYATPDAHWDYGFPIGGVAAFDSAEGGVISAGGVGFDISCGVRTLLTGLTSDEFETAKVELADALFADIPAGVGSTGRIRLDPVEVDAMLTGGARWAVEQGYGEPADLGRIEEHGAMAGADPAAVPDREKHRQHDEMGTLGLRNHYLEVQVVDEIFDPATAAAYGLAKGNAVVGIHCGSRGLGHQIGSEYLRGMTAAAVGSDIGQRYLGTMRAGINCALANYQIIMHLTREVFARLFLKAHLGLLFDVFHNTCKVEEHEVEEEQRRLHIHRKGATRAFGPGHPDLPPDLRALGHRC
ncbi:tRNA-splicing ligase RtcB [Skermanella aerolata]